MDDFEKTFKRLAIIFIGSLLVIFIAKSMLSKAATNLGKAAEVKKQQKEAAKQAAKEEEEARAAEQNNVLFVPESAGVTPAASSVQSTEMVAAESAPAPAATEAADSFQ